MTVFYGLRRSEVIGLKWDAVDFDNKKITISHTVVQMGSEMIKKDATKNSSSLRTLPLSDTIIKMLKVIKEDQSQNKLMLPMSYIDEGYVFTRSDGSIITPNYVTKHFKLLINKNDLPAIRFHDLRHLLASYLLSLGFNMKDIQFWLGHSNISTTMDIYVHLDDKNKKDMANLLEKNFIRMRGN